MNTFWTLHCFWAGLRILLTIVGGAGALIGVAWLCSMLIDKGYGKYVAAFWFTALAVFTIIMGMLQCAGRIK